MPTEPEVPVEEHEPESERGGRLEKVVHGFALVLGVIALLFAGGVVKALTNPPKRTD